MDCRLISVLSAACFAVGGQADAQEIGLVSASIDRFVEECDAAMSNPTSYFEDARSHGMASAKAVARVPDEDIFWVLDMMPPGEMYVHLGEVAGETRVYCHMGLFNVPEVQDAAATNAAFLSWQENEGDLQRTGGPVDLKSLMAGDEGMTGEQVEMTVQVFQHLINGWSASETVANVAIQTGMIEISAEAILPQQLTITD
jgi:hypothetical protein